MPSVSNDPVREVVFAQSEWDRVADDVKKALTRSGCILPQGVIDAMAGTVLEESLATRRRMAFMINAFINEYGDDCDEAKLSRLEAVMLLHQRDQHNMPACSSFGSDMNRYSSFSHSAAPTANAKPTKTDSTTKAMTSMSDSITSPPLPKIQSNAEARSGLEPAPPQRTVGHDTERPQADGPSRSRNGEPPASTNQPRSTRPSPGP